MVRQLAELTGGYWLRRGAWKSWLGLALITAYTLGQTWINALVARYTGDQLTAMTSHQASSYGYLLWMAVLVQLAYALLFLLSEVPYSLVRIHWQRWMTESFLADYMRGWNYYLMDRDRRVDNPDERIANDIALFINFPSDFYFGLVRALSNLYLFGGMLWNHRPSLVAFCFIWAMFGSLVTLAFNRPLLNLSFQQRKVEGDFRFGLVHVRTHAEAIALAGGEPVEEGTLVGRNQRIVNNSFRLVCWNALVKIWYSFYSAMSQLLPVSLIAPLFFAGQIDLSMFTQLRNGWGNVDNAFGFFGTQAWAFSTNGALIERLYRLRQECRLPRPAMALTESGASQVTLHRHSGGIETRSLRLTTPDGSQLLVEGLNLQVGPGDSVLLEGPSGVGKSSLVRGLAGLWRRGSGEVWLPQRSHLMFLPQRSYTSLGSLHEQVAYPLDQDRVLPEQVRQALHAVHLGYLEERFESLDVELDWEHLLSPGEQQRLAFARIWLHRPRFVILDEATSALDVGLEEAMYRLLVELGCSYLSVGHRPTLHAFHAQILELSGGGGWSLRSRQAD